MFILYFLLWILLNGRVSVEICVFGVVIAALLYAFSFHFMGYSVRKDLRFVRKIPAAAHLLWTLLLEVGKSACAVTKRVYSVKKPEPVLVQFEADLETETARGLLADCITLTPGTITGLQNGNHYVVHCLDAEMAEGLDQSGFVEILKELEER